MQNTEPASDVKKYSLLENSLLQNLLAYFGILAIIMAIASILIYFISISTLSTNSTLTNVLVGIIITLSSGALIGAVSYVNNSMIKK